MARPQHPNEKPTDPTPVTASNNPHDPSGVQQAPPPTATVPTMGLNPVNALGLVRGRPVQTGMTGGTPGLPQHAQAEAHVVGQQGDVVGSAVGFHPQSEAAQKVPPIKRYRVTNGGRISVKGTPHVLRPGKEVDERTYDLKMLRQQGIKLEEITEDDDYVQPDPLVDGESLQAPRG
jgi:hypothetical protein